MSKIKNIINLLRVRQYYKNILLFIGPFFSVSLLNFSLYPTLLLSFLVLCALSSINYIINDIIDIEVDKLHNFYNTKFMVFIDDYFNTYHRTTL